MKSLAPLYTVVFLAFVGISMSLLLFTSLFLQSDNSFITHLGLSNQQKYLLYGMLITMYPMGQFFGSPILGSLSDQYGRKPVLLASLAVTACIYLFIAFCLAHMMISMLAVGLFCAGFCKGNVVIAQTAIADVSPKHLRAPRFAIVSVMASLAFIIGPVLGALLSNPKIHPLFHFTTPHLALGLVLMMTAVWIIFGFEETKHALNEPTAVRRVAVKSLVTLKKLFTDSSMRIYYGLNFILYLSIFGFLRLYPVYLVSQFQIDSSMLSIFVSIVALPMIIMNGVIVRLLSKIFELDHLILFSCGVMGCGMALIVTVPLINVAWIASCVMGFFLALALSMSIAHISSRASQDKQGEVLGNNASIIVLSQVCIGYLGTSVMTVSNKLPLLICAACAVCSFLLLRYIVRTKRLKVQPPA